LDGESIMRPQNETIGIRPYLLSPGDPSDAAESPKTRVLAPNGQLVLQFRDGGPSSYAFNMMAFTGPPKFPSDPRDGTSNTIAFAECYFLRYFSPDSLPGTTDSFDKAWMMYSNINPALPSDFPPHPLNNRGMRRASFADSGWGDVVPVTTGDRPVSRPSIPGMTFQLKPQPKFALPSVVQTPFGAGLPVAMFDGSVRVLRPGIAPEVFWAFVTPAGGEVASDD